jgi:hypothetical protein
MYWLNAAETHETVSLGIRYAVPDLIAMGSSPGARTTRCLPGVDYELTELGHTLTEPLGALGRWAQQHFDEVHQDRESHDERTAERAVDF